ncbi:MAG: CHASE2 domain-containing protein [Thermodesulfobacteriota bacterium]
MENKAPNVVGKNRLLISRKGVLVALLVILVCTFAELATRSEWLKQIDYLYYDLWHILAGVQVEPKHVAIIAIDNETQLNYRDEPLVFWGPHFAKGIEVLRRLEVRIIGLDYLFTVSAESWLKKFEVPGSEKSRTFDGPIRAQLSSGKVVLIGWLASNEKGEGELILPIKDYLFVLPGGVSDVGFANFYSDEDGVIRRFAPALFDEDTLPNLTFATLLAVKGSGLEPSSKRWSLSGRGIYRDTTPYPIGFVGPPGTIPRLSFAKLLEPMAEKNPELQWLKGKVVIIAPEHVGIQDFHLAPYAREFWKTEGRMMSGAELHANIVETLLSGRFLKSIPSWVRILGMVIFLLIATLLFFRLHPLRGLVVGLLLGLFCAAIAYLLFRIQWIHPISGVQLGLALTYLGTLGFRLTGEEKERALLRQMFGQYVSDEVVEKLLAMGHRPDLGGEAIRVTILFSDIRNFTTISERLSPHQVVDMLNAYLGRACEAILEQGGTVDKYIGDAVMAVFGSPVPYQDHAQRALSAALSIKEMAREFRFWMHEHFAEVSLPEFDIGIGIHTGEAVIGNIGSPKRMEFTAIGDVVNTASRLEGLTKEFGWTIIASSATIHAAGSDVLTGKRERVFLKGREREIEVFEVMGLKLEKGGES